MHVRSRPVKPEPAPTKSTEAALDRAKLPRGKKADEDELDWGDLPSNTDRAGFDQRRIG